MSFPIPTKTISSGFRTRAATANEWFVCYLSRITRYYSFCIAFIDKAKLASLVGTLQREDLLPKERSQATLQLLQLYLSMQLNNNDYTSTSVDA